MSSDQHGRLIVGGLVRVLGDVSIEVLVVSPDQTRIVGEPFKSVKAVKEHVLTPDKAQTCQRLLESYITSQIKAIVQSKSQQSKPQKTRVVEDEVEDTDEKTPDSQSERPSSKPLSSAPEKRTRVPRQSFTVDWQVRWCLVVALTWFVSAVLLCSPQRNGQKARRWTVQSALRRRAFLFTSHTLHLLVTNVTA
jgi:hypothetical protein